MTRALNILLLSSCWWIALEAVAHGEPCTATTTLDGPSALTTPIARGLEGNGITVGRQGTCPGHSVRATVAPATARAFTLHIEDGFGRTSDRALSDPGTAVSLIESWAVEEDSALLASPSPPHDAGAPPAVETAAATTAAAGLRLYGGFASAVGRDGSVWGGGVVGGCARLGVSCLGAELFFAHDLGWAGDAADPGTTRSAAELLVTAALPLASGRWLLMPAVGIGAGWMRTRVAAEDVDSPAETANTLGFRGALSVLAGLALANHVAVGIGLGAVIAPSARANPPDGASAFTSSVPGEPRLAGRAMVACMVTP